MLHWAEARKQNSRNDAMCNLRQVLRLTRMTAKDREKALGSTTRHTITSQSQLPCMGIIATGQKVPEAEVRQGKTEIPRTGRTQCTLLYRDR